MTTNGPNRTPPDCAQESFPGNFGPKNAPAASEPEDIVEFSRQMLSRLSRTIEGDIIPRLMLAFDAPRSTDTRERSTGATLAENVEEFVQLLLAHDASVAARYVSTLRSDGYPLPTLYLGLLAPAARRLGVMWEQDECTFTDVTIGVCRMHQVLLEFSRCFDATSGSFDSGRNAMVVPVPGEQHTFGIFMVTEFLRRAGWNCFSGSPTTRRDFHRLVRAQEFDVVGISISTDHYVEKASELIAEIRNGPRNAKSVILVGGRALLEDPTIAQRIGADAMASDGREAVREARRLCRKAKRGAAK